MEEALQFKGPAFSTHLHPGKRWLGKVAQLPRGGSLWVFVGLLTTRNDLDSRTWVRRYACSAIREHLGRISVSGFAYRY